MHRTYWVHKAWPNLLSQTPHLCHNGLQGQAFVKQEKTLFLNPFKWLWSRAQRRSNFLSSYWSARWTETQRLIERGNDLISTFDTAGKHKLKPRKGKHTSHPSFPRECVDVSHSSTVVVTESIVWRVSLWIKWTEGLAQFPWNQHSLSLYILMNKL